MKTYAVMVENRQSPAKIYESYQEAEIEAIRLTNKEKLTSYVLMLIAKVELSEPKITSYRIGKRVLYKESDIESSLTKVEPIVFN